MRFYGVQALDFSLIETLKQAELCTKLGTIGDDVVLAASGADILTDLIDRAAVTKRCEPLQDPVVLVIEE